MDPTVAEVAPDCDGAAEGRVSQDWLGGGDLQWASQFEMSHRALWLYEEVNNAGRPGIMNLYVEYLLTIYPGRSHGGPGDTR